MTIPQEEIERLFPKLAAWVAEQESLTLKQGAPLALEDRIIASKLGVNQIDVVRFLFVSEIPIPTDLELRQIIEATGVINADTAGITFFHGIMLKKQLADRGTLAHELVHVMQYERLSGIEGFLDAYLKEVLGHSFTYPNGPLEKEAERLTYETFWNRNPLVNLTVVVKRHNGDFD
jgi:hypothetical protein